MSLKAKLEAVIYAAEEPVTLAQLAVLFAGEALEWKAARDAEQAPGLPLPAEAVAEAAAESLASPNDDLEGIAEAPVAEASDAESPAAEATLVEAEAEDAAAAAESAAEAASTDESAAAEATAAETDESDAVVSETSESATAISEAAGQLPESAVDAPEAHAESEESVKDEKSADDEISAEDETNAEDEKEDAAADEIEALSEASVETTSIAPFAAPAADLDAEPETAADVAAEPSDDAATASPTGAPVKQTDPNSKLAAAVSAEEAEFEARRQERRREREARETLRAILDELIAEYAADARGIEIREIAGGYRMGTKPEMHDAVRAFVKSLKPPLKLSLPALETLAVIAYKQPVTAPEVGEIRGVDSAGVLGSLMSRKLIATAGRKQVVGRPMLYKTTKEFLLRFGLKDVSELPSMEEFEKMAAQELSEEIADEGAAQSGDLFAESETATVPGGGLSSEESGEDPEPEAEPGPETTEAAPETAETESSESEPIATDIESVHESAAESTEAQASPTTENEATGATPDAEEIEVQS